MDVNGSDTVGGTVVEPVVVEEVVVEVAAEYVGIDDWSVVREGFSSRISWMTVSSLSPHPDSNREPKTSRSGHRQY